MHWNSYDHENSQCLELQMNTSINTNVDTYRNYEINESMNGIKSYIWKHNLQVLHKTGFENLLKLLKI
jgi:hypothetical protein